jgi:hypothetical protein
MQICSRCNTSSSDHISICPSCGASLPENSTLGISLKRMRENQRVSAIQVSVAGDACPGCQTLQGTYSKEAAPLLPHPGCSHGTGCRCYYEPVLTEVFP